jgi:hypothetical protein
MTRRIVLRVCILTALLAAVATVACTKLDDTPSDKLIGPLAFRPAGAPSAIPEEFGTLIAVTQNQEWATLWFQKSDRSIVAVFVNVEEGRIYEKGLTIPRK